MINLARCKEDHSNPGICEQVDRQVEIELTEAKIEIKSHETQRETNGEVPTKHVGSLCLWTFRRYWYYWVAKGPGIPAELAEPFHIAWGKEVRVDGHCGCPSPLEWFKGFAVGHYHIDTQLGLNAFADLLRTIYKP